MKRTDKTMVCPRPPFTIWRWVKEKKFTFSRQAGLRHEIGWTETFCSAEKTKEKSYERRLKRRRKSLNSHKTPETEDSCGGGTEADSFIVTGEGGEFSAYLILCDESEK